MDYNQAALELHKQNKGKLETVSKVPVKNREDLSLAYTPGVAEPCRKIQANPDGGCWIKWNRCLRVGGYWSPSSPPGYGGKSCFI